MPHQHCRRSQPNTPTPRLLPGESFHRCSLENPRTENPCTRDVRKSLKPEANQWTNFRGRISKWKMFSVDRPSEFLAEVSHLLDIKISASLHTKIISSNSHFSSYFQIPASRIPFPISCNSRVPACDRGMAAEPSPATQKGGEQATLKTNKDGAQVTLYW